MPVYRGTQFSRVFVYKTTNGSAVDITGFEFKMHIRRHLADDVPALELTTANGGIYVLDGPAGRIAWVLDETQTLSLEAGTYRFDVLRTDHASGGGPIRLFGGKFKVKTPVTRE